MNLSDVMDELAAALDTITGLRPIAYPDGQVNPPCAVVALPTELDYHGAYQGRMQRLTLPVVVLVSGSVPRVARDALAAYCNSSGASSVKAVLEAGTYTAMDSVTVTGVTFDVYSYNAVDYPAAIFDLDIVGSGS